MKFNRASLVSALTTASRVIERKAIQQICQNVLVRECEGGAEVIGTDLRTTACTVVECDGVGSFCAPAHDLLATVSSLDSDDVTVKVEETRVEVSGGGARFELPLDKPRDFPSVPSFEGKWTEMDAAAFASLLVGTEYAALPYSERVTLTGVILTPIEDGLEAAAQDGHRLSVNRAKLAWPGADPCIVPAVVAVPIAKMLDGEKTCEVRLSVSASANLIQVRAGKSGISSKLVDCLPVPYQGFVEPSNHYGTPNWADDPIILKRQEMIAALKRALSFKGEILKKDGTTEFDVSGDLSADGKVLTILRRTIQKSFTEEVKVTGRGQEKKLVKLNLRYLLDGLEHVGGEEVELHIKGELDPVHVTTKGRDRIAVVMPCHP